MTRVLSVAVPLPLPGPLDYLSPEGTGPGGDWLHCRVAVQVGSRELVGVVVDVAEASGDAVRLRPITSRLDAAPLLSTELVQSLRWAASYYAHPLGEVLQAALPVVLRRPEGQVDALPAYAINRAGAAALAVPGKPTRARRVLGLLAAGPLTRAALGAELGTAATVLRQLEREGLVDAVDDAGSAARPPLAGPPLNPEQASAFEQLATGLAPPRFGATLLEGVTGSGKTEVYLALIARVLAAGRQALVLVPEIGLTPQAVRRYEERLGVRVAALHSGLAEGERARAWLAAARGTAPVVLGTRSAVLTPLARAGLIVIDEEHDASYKQQDGFRYHARDLALVRARALGVPVVLGSATPALETLANVDAGRYQALRLSRRAGDARTPNVQLIDLRRQRLHEGRSAPLVEAVAGCVARGEQALVFRNRRGYAPVLLCHDCGWHADCPRCDAHLTLHRAGAGLRCHHCGHAARTPSTCPDCGSGALLPLGAGTERLEEALVAQVPGATVIRMDSDTTRARGARESRWAAIESGAPAVLVGTQMLAKGHDLPNLTLAALVDVDGGLFSADFRGAERLAQLVVQVAGRAGRGRKPGTVLLQTHHPGHPLLRRLLEGGYGAFAREELAQRQALGFPPYAHFALLRAEAQQRADVDAFLVLARAGFEAAGGVMARGPLPAPLPRRAGYVRGQLLLESRQRPALQRALASTLDGLRARPQARRVRWSIDVDPVDMY